MRSLVFHKPGCISLEERPVPAPAYGAAVIQVTLTTICGGWKQVTLTTICGGWKLGNTIDGAQAEYVLIP
jgi:threonine dehydrogenase-like Zn-dependent dehydrogenase